MPEKGKNESNDGSARVEKEKMAKKADIKHNAKNELVAPSNCPRHNPIQLYGEYCLCACV